MSLRVAERVPLSKLQLIEQSPSQLKRKAKISTRRLPEDFFLCTKSQCQTSRKEIHTQAVSRRVSYNERVSETRETNVRGGTLSTRLKDDEQTMELLRGVIATSR